MSRRPASAAIIPKPLRRLVCTALCALAAVGAAAAPAPDPAAAGPSRDDLRWLARLTYGVDGATLERFQRLGKAAFLEEQLAATDTTLPPTVQARIDRLPIAHTSIETLLADLAAHRREIQAQDDATAKLAARRELRRDGVEQVRATMQRELLRAVYSPAQLQEQMVWFWLNHFSVFARKGPEPWLLADYLERAIRPHALGRFRDLVLATLTHPAMLVYLDNARNAVGHVNENYARELMELHTLGVDAGYTQRDVQELARILTGVGVALPGTARRGARTIGDGAFVFQPARHDYGDKVLLGHTIRGRGFAEVEQAVDLLVRQPACARFVSRRLAQYFVGDEPPPALIEAMAATFRQSDGDIRAVLRTLFTAHEFTASLGGKFKDPMHYVVSALRLEADGGAAVPIDAALRWLNELGEPWFGHPTPDGYPLGERDWASSGQLAARFTVARAIARSVDPEALAGSTYARVLRPYLSPTTRAALDAAASPQERTTLLLASPEFNYR